MSLAQHHLHQRKRIYKNLEPYPHPVKPWLDRMVYAAGIAGPVMTLPQIWKIWAGGQAEGISVASWTGYLVTAVIFFYYGMVHKEKPIALANGLWIIFDLLIIAGALIYG